MYKESFTSDIYQKKKKMQKHQVWNLFTENNTTD